MIEAKANPVVLNVVILKCGQYELEGQKATLELIRFRRCTHASLRPEHGKSLVWPVRSIVSDGPRMEIQGPNTFWRFLVVDHDTNDPRR